ncbi:MAG: hypothetical protein K8W52_37565 [Deltaproteobacteria bacterium]|nr:hypothetical protein [Deltaproteobacteria bacterium]
MPRRRAALVLASLLALTSRARADYWTDQQNEKLRQIEYAFDHYTPPDWFDGARITGTPDPRTAEASVAVCASTLERFTSIFPSVDATIRQQARAQALQRRYDTLVPRCRALAAAVKPYVADAQTRAAQAAKDEEAERERTRRRYAFLADLPQDTKNAITDLAHLADPALDGPIGFSEKAADASATRAALAPLRALCARHAPIADPHRFLDAKAIWEHPQTICALPDRADALIADGQRATIAAGFGSYADGVLASAQKYLDGETSGVADDMQRMILEPTSWTAELDKLYAPRFAAIHQAVPASFYAPLFAKNDALKAKIDQDGVTNVFTPPAFHDRAAEAVARKAWAKALPGIKVIAIGAISKTWDVFDEKTWVKSDATYDYYRVNKGKNKYKRGWALIRIPGRPYCQAREWIVHRVYNGPIQIDALGGDGMFMKCD